MVIFNVRADKALHYQWSRDGQDITHMTHSYCKGATTSTLYIRAVAEEHEGRYNCAVSNDIGSVDSESAELVVGKTLSMYNNNRRILSHLLYSLHNTIL